MKHGVRAGSSCLPQAWATSLGLHRALSLWRCWIPLHLCWQKKYAGSWRRCCPQLGCAGSREPISSLFAESRWHYATLPCISILFSVGQHGWFASAPRLSHPQGLPCGPSAPRCCHPLSLDMLGCKSAQLLRDILGKLLGLALQHRNELFLGFPSTCFPPPAGHVPSPTLACP